MTKSLLTLLGLATLATVANATTVAVVEIGKGGVVHRAGSFPSTSTRGILSFWNSIHDAGSDGQPRKERATQIPGMSVVPDLFNRADGGLVIGITGSSIDLESMPTVAGIIEQDGALAHMHTEGNSGRELGRRLSAKTFDAAEFESALKSNAKSAVSANGNKLEAVFVSVNQKEEAAQVDATLKQTLKDIASTLGHGKTVLAYVAVDDEAQDARRRLSIEERKLEDQNNAGDDQYANQYDGIAAKYGYKSIFQIQYFNIVLWTALGLFLILLSANMMTMYMPLMPDTLLFGESAKMVAE